MHVDRDGNAARNIWLWALLRAIQKEEEKQSDQDMAACGDVIKRPPPKKKRKKASIQQPKSVS